MIVRDLLLESLKSCQKAIIDELVEFNNSLMAELEEVDQMQKDVDKYIKNFETTGVLVLNSQNFQQSQPDPDPIPTITIGRLRKRTTCVSSHASTAGNMGSGLKTSQTELRERELKRKHEASQKKEALLLATTEKKRKKREERELKVQQQKQAQEKDKKKQLADAEKAKDDKAKQLMAEKEANLLKAKEEVARKRAAVAKRAEEQKRVANIPIYLRYETPLLPTPDCYDSDDESANTRKFTVPKWQLSKNLMHLLTCIMRYCNKIGKFLVSSGAQSPDLQSIFPAIEPHKLKRTSSAIWNATQRTLLEL